MHILSFIDPKFLISTFGLIGVIAIIFMETGFFFGFFFPGDSLLFTAGFLASQSLFVPLSPYSALAVLAIGSFVAAVVGDSVGYAFGKKIGPSLFSKENSTFFNKKNLAKAQHFYEKQGPKTIVLARFMPVIRTFVPIVAGIGIMKYRTFIAYNVIGGFLWTILMTCLGFALGSVIPDPDKYVLPVIILIIIVSAIPPVLEFMKSRRVTAIE